jgi:hypothetical protein
MTQSDLSCADSDIAPPSPHYTTQLIESSGEVEQSDGRNPRLGVLVILATAVVFYGSIAMFIIKFL